MIYSTEDCKKVVPVGNQSLIELSPEVSTPRLGFHQKYHFLPSGRERFNNLAPNTKSERHAGNSRRANSRCSPYQEANSIWLVSQLQRIEIRNVYS